MARPVIGIVIAIVLLVVAIPYVARIRHPRQRPFAAYFIFVTIFAVASIVLLGMLVGLANALGLAARLEEALPALVLLLLVLLPALFLARWQARKPPWRQAPPP